MKKLFIATLTTCNLLSCNSVSEPESQNLFNGEDLNGWHVDVPDMDEDSAVQSPFLVRNGLLDPRAKPEALRKLIPKSVPSGFPVLHFQ